MTQYRFKVTIKVAGVKYTAGDVAGADELPAGNVESMLRNDQIEELGSPAPPLADRQADEIKRLRALLDAKGEDARDAEIKSLREELADVKDELRKIEADAKEAAVEAAAEGLPELGSRQSAKAEILRLRAEVEGLKAAAAGSAGDRTTPADPPPEQTAQKPYPKKTGGKK
jgi:gamma-glutamyl:cysteine ligase YbdK (ATP-grasp superfamily)